MPGFDGTGPQGRGPMTGGGRGFCTLPVNSPRTFSGRFFGHGRGRGFRNRYWATGLPGWVRAGYGYPAFGGGMYPYGPELTPKEEMDMLREEARVLKQQLVDIEAHLITLEKAKSKDK